MTISQPDIIATAREIATAAHAGQVDKLGADYIGHPIRVAGYAACAGGSDEVVAAAWLHDVLEDTDITADDLRHAGIPDSVVAAVDAVSHRAGESVEEYAARILDTPLALDVKKADLSDNTDPARLEQLDRETQEHLTQKYARIKTLLGLPV